MLLLEFADFAKLTPKINVKFNEFFVSNIDDIMQKIKLKGMWVSYDL